MTFAWCGGEWKAELDPAWQQRQILVQLLAIVRLASIGSVSAGIRLKVYKWQSSFPSTIKKLNWIMLNGAITHISLTTTTKNVPKVLWYTWEAYCNTNLGGHCDTHTHTHKNSRSTDKISLSSERRGTKVLQYKLEAYCNTNSRCIAILCYSEVVVVAILDVLLNLASVQQTHTATNKQSNRIHCTPLLLKVILRPMRLLSGQTFVFGIPLSLYVCYRVGHGESKPFWDPGVTT